MLSVVICEDNKIQRNRIKEIVKKILAEGEYDFEVKLCTDEPEEIIKYMENNKILNGIYILDVDLGKNINGIELAKLIRERDTLGYIVFLTTHSEMSFLTFKYKVEAVDYIVKDNFSNIESNLYRTFIYIDKNYSTRQKKEDILTLEQEDRKIKIVLDDVMFIETAQVAHKLIIHERNRIVEIYGTLKEFEDILPENFYRSHRAFIVNRNNIIEVNKRDRIIKMKNEEECLVSYRYLGGLMK